MDFDQFLNVAQRTSPFLASGGRAFATVNAPIPVGVLALPIRSRAFRQWFFDQCYSTCNTIPTGQTFAAILHHLDAQAARDPADRNIVVPVRVASAGNGSGQILIDLANPSGEFIEISPGGWRIHSGRGFPFETSPSTLSLPYPEPPTSEADPLDTLRATLNLGPPDGPAWLRTLAWLLAALRGAGPYPILILRGPAGSGKSFAGRALRAVIDPCVSSFAPLPIRPRELPVFARHNLILAFDHVESLTPALADSLCRLSSGAGIACREPGQPEPLQLWIRRPILLTVAAGWTPPPGIAARALTVDLPPLQERRLESDLTAAIEQALPKILGALCDAISRALAAPPAPGPFPTRHADTLAWAQAAFPCRTTQLRDAFQITAPTDPLVDSVRELLAVNPSWSGTATDLLKLMPIAPDARALSAKMRKAVLPLAEAGIDIQFPRLPGGVRVIELFASQNLPEISQTTDRKAT